MWLIRKLLFPFSLVYAFVVYIRNLLYDLGWLTSRTFATPTIVVGNLSVGGTGKTPMVEFLLRMLLHKGKVALLSRGYKRKTKGFLLANKNATVYDLGDEPYLIHAKFPDCAVAVDADRVHGILQLEQLVGPSVIVLDDAYQHRKVSPTLSILLTTYTLLYVDDWYLPTGNLRDSKRSAKRANLIIVTKCPPELAYADASKVVEKLKAAPWQTVLFTFYSYGNELMGQERSLTFADLVHTEVTVVTGIADPTPFLKHLSQQGLTFEHLEFPDHHFFTSGELSKLQQKPIIITTEKDYVRLKGKLNNVYYLPVAHEFLFDGKALLLQQIEKLR